MHRLFVFCFLLIGFSRPLLAFPAKLDDHGPDGEFCTRTCYPGFADCQSGVGDSNAIVQTEPPSDTELHKERLAIVGATLLGSMAAIHVYQQNGWWKDNRQPFHFQEDLIYGLNVDKIGHFYTSAQLGFTISRSLEWANVPEVPALWFGSAGALLFQTYVEAEDGFSTWGFDRVDYAADVAGAAWPIARYYAPFLQNVNVKLSYHPSPMLGSTGGTGFRGQQHLMFDDYEGQTYWMSLRVHNLLPESLQRYWPEFLCIALGYAARNVDLENPYRVFFLAFDVDMTEVIPPRTSFLKSLAQVLNFMHMPLPAVRILPGAIWYGLYF